MIKSLSIFLLVMAVTAATALCQTADNYASALAKADAKKFRLDKQLWKQFKQKHFPENSDYFKPTLASASDTTMLKDSAYVSAFRKNAYKNTLHRHTAGHYVLIYGGITAGVVIIASIIILETVGIGLKY